MQIWNSVHFEGEIFKECKFGTEYTLESGIFKECKFGAEYTSKGEIFKECKFGAEYTSKVKSSRNANLELSTL
jgi:hypothetical protein